MKYCAASVLLLVLAFSAAGCGSGADPLFERLPASRTGVQFANSIVENDSLLNPIDYDYFYNGGGVGVGDVNNDGRPDLYFTGNAVDNRLYLNRGDFHFEDVTATAGVGAPGAWATGVAMVDINQDGWLDIYVCVAGKVPPTERANLLFVNQGLNDQGVPTFEEKAEAYGIADTGYSVHAAFFDYDRDGDLDLYVLTNTVEDFNRNDIRPRKTEGQARSTDRLYRNNGDGTFTDVSEEAGITIEGYGLGLVVSDINKDGWPDIYVANDFITNDLLWINNGDPGSSPGQAPTFTNKIDEFLKSQSYNGMGADVADFNNDGRVDIVVMDMLPRTNRRRKMMLSGGTYNRFHMALRLGYEPQYVRNTLQLNRGVSPDSSGTLVFSEIGRLAGIQATGWSWAPLFADFDNDGWKDLFITNGYGKDVTNLDFLAYGQQTAFFGSRAANREKLIEAMKDLPEVLLPNRIFHNDGDLTFTEKTEAWGLGRPSLSNGAAFADLDGDGDLDLVTNNINAKAFILENHASERDSTNYLRVDLHGPEGNLGGLGAKVILTDDGTTQYHDHTIYRGYQSTVGSVVHFGLAADSTVDSLEVIWPDGRYQLLTDIAANQVLDVYYEEAGPRDEVGDRPRPVFDPSAAGHSYLFREVAARRGLTYRHEESVVNDFKLTPLLPHKYSMNGPGIAVGDVDGNGLDDVYVGADIGQARKIFLQTAPGRFVERTLSVDSSAYADMGALFFDAEGDGDLDLYVVSGGNVALGGDPAYQDRLYLNDPGSSPGQAGRFRRAADALPEEHTSGSVVTAADYDADGDLDLFVGGRVIPGKYPLPPRSYLLRNDSENGQVKFTDITAEVAPELAEVGLVTTALWTDFSGDGRVDLLVAGEWMPITFFKNEGGHFENVTEQTGLENTSGWWNSLAAGDFDGDGGTDYVAGNLGLNTKYEASRSEPVRIHAGDYDDNGDLDPVMSRYIQGVSYPAHTRDAMVDQILGMSRRFPSYSAYAEASFDEIFTDEEMEGAYVAEAVRFESSYLENLGDGTFRISALPLKAQFAPTFGLLTGDYNGDGHLDILMVGNWHAPQPQTGWYNASVGAFLAGDGTGRFRYVHFTKSGFFVHGDARGLAEVMTGPRGSLVVATQNDDRLRVFSNTQRGGARNVELRPLDHYAILTFSDGTTRKQEFYYGSGYLSQSSRFLRVPDALEKAVIYDFRGNSRTLRF